jgi:LysR family cyn operon transcriptional activator
MELRLLEYFLTVSEELHFTRAAEKLGISQPTLSQQIKVLEGTLGISLFKRVGKKVFLTESGEVLKYHAIKTFYELEQAKIAINELAGFQRGKITVGCAGSHLLTSSVITFHKVFPKIKVSVLELPTDEIKQNLLTNKIDIGIIYLPSDDERLLTQPLFQEEFYLVVSTENKLSNKKEITTDELKDIEINLLRNEYLIRQIIDQSCKHIGLEIEPSIELSTLEALLQLTRKNVGATILPGHYLATVDNSGICKIKVKNFIEDTMVGIIYHKDTYYCETMKMFIRYLKGNYEL